MYVSFVVTWNSKKVVTKNELNKDYLHLSRTIYSTSMINTVKRLQFHNSVVPDSGVMHSLTIERSFTIKHLKTDINHI
jgi:hypothetical protein